MSPKLFSPNARFSFHRLLQKTQLDWGGEEKREEGKEGKEKGEKGREEKKRRGKEGRYDSWSLGGIDAPAINHYTTTTHK